MVNLWDFYYDEAYHDRGVTSKNSKINFLENNSSDTYVGVFCGWEHDNASSIEKQFVDFEKRYKNIFTVNQSVELKSLVIKRKNFKNGFASFLPLTVDYYSEFFSLLENKNIILHIGLFSKTELVISNFLKSLVFDNTIMFCHDAFLYSVTKFMHDYRNLNSIDILLNKMIGIRTKDDINELIVAIVKSIDEIISEINKTNFKISKSEYRALTQIRNILGHARSNSVLSSNLRWDYDQVFIGFNKILQERKIQKDNVNLLIDREKGTLKSAIKIGRYKNCICVESNEYFGIRISDTLAHFFGEIIILLDKQINTNYILRKNCDRV
jgi:hypothetical protein